MGYNTEDIKRSLKLTAETWVAAMFPNGKRIADTIRIGSISGELGSSLSIFVCGQNAGTWHDFATGERGGALDLIMKVHNVDFKGALEIATNSATIVIPRTEAIVIQKKQAQAEIQRNVRTKATIENTILTSTPIANTIAAIYLQERRIAHIKNASYMDLKFHPKLRHSMERKDFPALIGIVRDVSGEIIGLHRTYLDNASKNKANISPNKMMLGKVGCGAVRLGDINDGIIGISEGIETGLSIRELDSNIAVWAALSTTNMRNIKLPEYVEKVHIFADNDNDGINAANALKERLTIEGKHAVIHTPQGVGDFNDYLISNYKERPNMNFNQLYKL